MESENDFVPVLDEKDLGEGKMKVVSVEGIPILFIRQEGKIFVINNQCPHMACALSGGTLDGLVVVCPCHDWRFNLETGEYEDEPVFKLKMYEWKVKSGKIWVKLEEET